MKTGRRIIGIVLVVVGIGVIACSFFQHHGTRQHCATANSNRSTIRENIRGDQGNLYPNQRQHMGQNRRFDFQPNQGQDQQPNFKGGQRQ